MSAFHGDNYEVLAHRFFKRGRAVMFDLVAKLELKATSCDDSVLVALVHARTHEAERRDFIPLPPSVGGAAWSRASCSPRATGGVPSPTAARRGWWRGGISR